MTGDVTPDTRAVANADLIVTTPEKWDGVSRSWQTRSYVKAVALLVIDEIHLLGTLNYRIIPLYTYFMYDEYDEFHSFNPLQYFSIHSLVIFTRYTKLNCYILLDIYLYVFTVKESN